MSSETPDVSPAVTVVVATRDRATRLAGLLGSLRAQTLSRERFEVVVVDDGSCDATPGLLARERVRGGLDLRVMRRAEAAGPAVARDAGWRVARAPVIAFTDDDCEAEPRWLETLLAALEQNPKAILQGRTEPIPREAADIGLRTRTLRISALGPYYQTCNMAYPREWLERLGGFDLSYPTPGGEDTDLAWRALELGAGIVFAADACVYHAVTKFGLLDWLRFPLRWTDAMQVFARHPGLRRQVCVRGVLWKRSHGLLLQALVAVLCALRFPPALLLALPYARHLVGRCRATGASAGLAPLCAAHDAVETYAALRGAARYRVFII